MNSKASYLFDHFLLPSVPSYDLAVPQQRCYKCYSSGTRRLHYENVPYAFPFHLPLLCFRIFGIIYHPFLLLYTILVSIQIQQVLQGLDVFCLTSQLFLWDPKCNTYLFYLLLPFFLFQRLHPQRYQCRLLNRQVCLFPVLYFFQQALNSMKNAFYATPFYIIHISFDDLTIF